MKIMNRCSDKMNWVNLYKKILSITSEFGYQSGKWSENEYLQEEISLTEFTYITLQCEKMNFNYKIDWGYMKETADEYEEKLITATDIENKIVTENNFIQFDFLACDIKEQLIDFLKDKMYNEILQIGYIKGFEAIIENIEE